MISPEYVYETCYKNKNTEEILAMVRSLKNSIDALKTFMEALTDPMGPELAPYELYQIEYYRMCLDAAKNALLKAGVTYPASKKEQQAELFQNRIKDITNIVFGIGGVPCGLTTYHVRYHDSKVIIKKEVPPLMPNQQNMEIVHSLDQKDFSEALKSIHIGEWEKDYSPWRYGYYIADGLHWYLEITYSDGKHFRVNGENIYPYNYIELKELLYIGKIF